MSTGRKRGLEFNTDFTIPKKRNNNADPESNHTLNNLYEEPSTSIQQVQIKTILPFLRTTTTQHKERPKNNADKKGANRYPVSDQTLPPELTAQFQPLFCKLCECQHTSNVMAKLHYDSKKHEKKVRKFLVEHAEKTDTPVHPRAVAVKHEDNDPKYFYCDCCNMPLTGKLHSESHYMSKNHRRVILGLAPPARRERADCFGGDFVKEVHMQKLRCQLCNVAVTSEQQMELHMGGSRHKKKLHVQESKAQSADDTTILSTLSTAVPKTDLSVFRTPTGFYYCNPCDITLNSEIQFKQHLDSKRHKKKVTVSA